MKRSLAGERKGSVVDVVGVEGRVDGILLRLFEMGLTRGARVVVTRRAPLGDPLEIEVRGTRLCLRNHDAARFLVDEPAS